MVIRLTVLFATMVAAGPALAQVLEVRPVTPPAVTTSIETLRAAQEGFETFRRRNAPAFAVRSGPDRCDEQVGRFCYWYEEDGPSPPNE